MAESGTAEMFCLLAFRRYLGSGESPVKTGMSEVGGIPDVGGKVGVDSARGRFKEGKSEAGVVGLSNDTSLEKGRRISSSTNELDAGEGDRGDRSDI
jgi:hypothetical protein